MPFRGLTCLCGCGCYCARHVHHHERRDLAGVIRSARAAAAERSSRYRQLVNPFEPVRIFSDDQVESMHLAALGILERSGHARAVAARARGCSRRRAPASTKRARWCGSIAPRSAAALASVPREANLIAGNPPRSCRVGGPHVVFAPVAGPPSVSDLQRGKRTGSIADFRDFVRLSQAFDVIHVLGQMTEPQDVPVQRAAPGDDASRSSPSGDKAPYFYCRGDGQLADCFAMLRIAHGIDEAAFQAEPRCYSICNTNSPLQLDVPMTEGIIEFRPARAVDDRHALHARRRDGADHDSRRADARPRRSPVRHHPHADRAPRRAGHVRQLHLERRHEVRLAGVRYARVRQGGLRRRPAGAAHRRAVALLERDREPMPPTRRPPTSRR